MGDGVKKLDTKLCYLKVGEAKTKDPWGTYAHPCCIKLNKKERETESGGG